jgi:hypothetical protein
MKKFTILFFISLILIGMNGWSQGNQLIRNPNKGSNRGVELQCPPGSVFSQVPQYVDVSWSMSAPRIIADDFTTVSPPLSMRFWAMNLDPMEWSFCMPAELTFIVRFYERNLSDPTLPGAEAAAYTITTEPQYGNIAFGDDFQIDLSFPEPAPITDGWVALSCITDIYPCWFTTWHGQDMWGTGLGNACAYMQNWETGEWYWQAAVPDENELSMAFCLGGPVPPVPVSNWALFIGLALIATFIIIRYKRA